MLDHHPLLAVANDSHFIPHVLEEAGETASARLTPELVRAVRGYRRFARLGLSDAVVADATVRADSFASFVSRLYSAYAGERGKPLGGEKTPDYVKHLPLLHTLFPWAKTLHIVRDGRDVALSTLEWAAEKGLGRFLLWRTQPVAVCALFWRQLVATGRRDGWSLGADCYREVRYEQLVKHPTETISDLLRFVDLRFARETVTYYEGKVRRDPGLSAKQAWLPPTTGLRDWRREMEPGDVELFEAIAGDLLSSLGYPRAFPTIPEATRQVAEDCRRRWESELAERRARRGRRDGILGRA